MGLWKFMREELELSCKDAILSTIVLIIPVPSVRGEGSRYNQYSSFNPYELYLLILSTNSYAKFFPL